MKSVTITEHFTNEREETPLSPRHTRNTPESTHSVHLPIRYDQLAQQLREGKPADNGCPAKDR